ncbi:ATP-grasp domain-containing protein [Bacillus thuringiensis]|uniref:ATP-grasp domain-containing protein n=1 Tax=Bacillus thuringiensis TaxID=1428 RepID=UPI000BF5336D|nr:hypothetical protein [Bacillus thuringiensis]PFB88611.1 hypothetical protein CN283_11935 [Bacillus thuringiensis]PGN40733.1 hypothetical protein CN968_17045 [Bacillus thuringiensis]
MILFIGLSSDKTIIHAVSVAKKLKYSFLFFDLKKFLTEGEYFWDSKRSEGYIGYSDIQIKFPNTNISGIYARPILLFNQELEEVKHEMSHRLNILLEILSNVDILTINRPYRDHSNSSKMYHTHLLGKCGFKLPYSILTNDEEEAKKFISSKEKVVFKGSSSEKTIVSLYTQELSSRLKFLYNSPVLFQEYIEGADVRTHLIGSELFSEKIESEGVDYRYQKETNQFSNINIPNDIVEKCFAYQKLSELHFIGFDFKITNSGEYIAMEANPMPGYDGYDRRANLEISKVLLEMLNEGVVGINNQSEVLPKEANKFE